MASRLGKNQTASLEVSIGEDGSQTRGDTLPSNGLSPEDAAIMKNAKARLAEWMKNLSETDRKILALAKAGKNLREVGEAVGKSHEFVRRRIRCKILLIPRIPETLAKELAKTKDPKSGNFLYVRAYTEGGIHAVIVTKNGVVEGARFMTTGC